MDGGRGEAWFLNNQTKKTRGGGLSDRTENGKENQPA